MTLVLTGFARQGLESPLAKSYVGKQLEHSAILRDGEILLA